MTEVISNIYTAILHGDGSVVPEYVQSAIDEGIKPATILNEGMVKAMDEVGRLFDIGDYFIPDMLVAARAMQEGLKILRPVLVKAGVKSTGKVIIGTVKGDLHDIGKNLVGMMLEGAAFEVVDLGVDVSPEAFVEALERTKAPILGMSALLTTTMGNMKTVIKAIEAAGLRDKVKIIVGGAPLSQEFSKNIGADGYSSDANHAVTLIKSLL